MLICGTMDDTYAVQLAGHGVTFTVFTNPSLSDTLLDDRVDPIAVVQSSRLFSLRYRLGLGKQGIEFAEGARGAVEAQEAEPKRLQKMLVN